LEGPEGGGTGDVVVKVELLRQVAGGGGLNDVGLREERPIFAKACRLGEPGEVRESGVADKATGEAGTVDADLERRGREGVVDCLEILHHRASGLDRGGAKVRGGVDGIPGWLAEGGGEAFNFVVGILIDRYKWQANSGEDAGLGEGEDFLGEPGVITGDELDADDDNLRSERGAIGAGVES